MYEKDFGLNRRAFPATPDRAFYYPATTHEAALAELLRAVNEDEGFALLTAAPGMGKTLLVHCLLERLGQNVASAFLTNSHFADRTAFFQALLFDLSLPYEEGTEQVLRLRLTEYLLKACGGGGRTVLFVDEAHHLDLDLLEELRLLGNLEGGAGKAFQVILVGQEGLLETLARPELAAVNQRLLVRTHLEPLGLEESVDYLLHHVRVAGGRPETILEEAAVKLLARGTRGIPRLLNQAAHQALALAHQADMGKVDTEAALEALGRLGLEADIDLEADLDADADAAPTLPIEVEQNLNPAREDAGEICRIFDSPRPA